MVYSLLLFIFSFSWRITYFFLKPNEVSTDEHFHLYYINLIKENNHSVPLKNRKALGGPNDCTYPSFYHKILSYFSPEFLKKYGAISSIIYDIMSISILAICMLIIDNDYEFYNFFLILSLYLIFPSLIFQSIGPRSFSLTPRNFSQFLCTIGYAFLFLFIHNNHIIYMQISAIFFAMSMLSSKFSVQYVVFISIVLSVMLLSFLPLIFLTNIILWMILIGGKTFFRQIKGHLEHSWWYMHEGIRFIEIRWQWRKLFTLLCNLNLRESWQIIMFHNPVTRGVILNLSMFLYVILLDTSDFNFLKNYSFLIIESSIFLWILTQFSIFRAFGEPERYIEFSIPLFLFLLFSDQNFLYLKFFIFLYSISFCVYIFYLNKKQNREKSDSLKHIEEIKRYLDDKQPKNILCTANNETYIFSSSEDCFLVGFFANNKMMSFYNYFYDLYPDVNAHNLKRLCIEYDITHIVINKMKKISEMYDLSFAKIVVENKLYKILEIK